MSNDAAIAGLELDEHARLTIVNATLTTSALDLRRGSVVTIEAGGRIQLPGNGAANVSIADDAAIRLGESSTLVGPSAIARMLAADADPPGTFKVDPRTQTVTLAPPEKKAPDKPLSTADTRLSIGLEQIGSASTDVSSHPLVEFMLTAPISDSGPPSTRLPSSERVRLPRRLAWFDARFSGINQAGALGITEIVGGLDSQIVTPKSTQAVQGIGIDGGFEQKIGDGSAFEGGHYQFEPTVIVGVGAETPLNPHLAPAVFLMSDEARNSLNISDPGCPDRANAATCTYKYKYLAIVSPDRDRFVWRYAAGVRFKTHHFDCPDGKDACAPGERREVNFPGAIDITLGQDASVTGGRLRSMVLKLNAFYPLPVEGVGRVIYVFGTMGLALRRHLDRDPLLLSPPDSTVKVPGPDVFVHRLDASETDRDTWKVGIAFDLISLAKGFAKTDAKK